MKSNNKLTNLEKAIVIILSINKHKNEKSAISSNEIIQQIKTEYDYNLDRRAIDVTVKSFNKIQDDYKIETIKSNPNKYYFSSLHELSFGEAKAIIDLIYSSHFFTETTKERFISQMKYFFNTKEAEKLNKVLPTHICRNEDSKSFDESFTKITTAIHNKEIISFDYVKPTLEPNRKTEFKKHIYPVETVSENNTFYLYCYKEETKEIRNYRIDYIQNVKLLDHKYSLKQSVIEEIKNKILDSTAALSPKRYASITLKFSKDNYANMIDKFGHYIKRNVQHFDDKNYLITIENCPISPTFYGWIIGFEGKIQIISPKNEVNEFKSFLNNTFINN